MANKKILNRRNISVFVILITILILILITIFAVRKNAIERTNSEIAKNILSKMDLNVDPCEDFYQFSCGSWLRENEIPKSEARISTFLEMEDNNQEILHKVLEGDYPVDKTLSAEDQALDKEIFNKAKTIYDTCMDEDTINKQGKEPIINLLNEIDLYNNKTRYEGVNGVSTLVADLHKYNVDIIFNIRILGNDYVNPMAINIVIGQPELLLIKNKYNNENIISQYKTTIIETLNRLFGDQKGERNFELMANKIVEFEKKLSEVLVPEEDLQNPMAVFNPTTIKDLTITYPNINWELYVNTLLENKDISYPLIPPQITNKTPKYFEGLNKILGETDNDTLIYYSEWKIISKFIMYISDAFNKPFDDFDNSLIGIKEKRKRYKTCTEITEKIMGNALGKYYIQKVFNDNIKVMTKEIIVNIKQSMEDRIQNVSWLDLFTAGQATETLKSMTYEKIGYPDYIFKPKELFVKEYEGFEVDSSVFLNSIVNYEIFFHKKIEVPKDHSKWDMTPQTVNAYYHPGDNSINVPAGILQPPLLDLRQPDYLNYGAIGSVIGHELTHAFDNNSDLFNPMNTSFDRWSNSTHTQFNNLSKCFEDQYSQYEIEVSDGKKIKMSGKITLGENIPDNGGINRAFEAWKLSSNDTSIFNERNKVLPDLSKFTAEQLFFVSYSQFWCEKITPELAEKHNESNPHSRGKHRVIGTLSNNDYFAKAFNCPKKSPMNPEKKCILW